MVVLALILAFSCVEDPRDKGAPAPGQVGVLIADTIEEGSRRARQPRKDRAQKQEAVGEASYYGYELAGNPTASGEPFDPEKMTAAHRKLPFGTRVRVTNLRNKQSVVVRVNDRGPFAGDRIIDVSRAAAEVLGMLHRGRALVRVEVLSHD